MGGLSGSPNGLSQPGGPMQLGLNGKVDSLAQLGGSRDSLLEGMDGGELGRARGVWTRDPCNPQCI